MEGHPRPPAGWPPQAQPQPPHDPVSPSQYTTLPEVAPNRPDNAPEVLYSSAPETVPPQYHTPYSQHAMSDVSPTVYGPASEDKQLAYPEYPSMAQPEYPSMAPSPPGHELLPEMAEKPATMKKKKTMWILVAIAILLLVIGAAVGGGVGATAAARSRAAEEASQLGSTSQSSSSTTLQSSSSTASQPISSSTSQPVSNSTSQPSSSSTPQPSSNSTSPGSVSPSSSPTGGGAGDACIAGTGQGNFLGLCNFATHYNYTPAPCTCTAYGALVQPPPSTGKKGYPRVDVPNHCDYLGLCSFAWDRGYTDNLAACGSDPAGGAGCT